MGQRFKKSNDDAIWTKGNVLGTQESGDSGDIKREYSLSSLGKRPYHKPKTRLRLTINPQFTKPLYWYPLGKRFDYNKYVNAAKRNLLLRIV